MKQRWQSLDKDFFKEIEKATGFKWSHKIYRCHLSSTFICGGCYDAQKGNVVSVFPRLKHSSALDALFHELAHLHFWDSLVKMKYGKKEKIIAREKFWILSEIAVNYPLQKIKIKNYKPRTHIYPQHKKLWGKIKRYWGLNFKEFIMKSLEEI